MHERIFYRRLVTGLLKGQTAAGDNVFSSRVIAWDAEDLPGISVYTPAQKGANNTALKAPSFDSTLTLNIEIATVANDKWDDELDCLCEEVEDRLLKNNAFLKEFSRIENFSTTLKYDDGGEYPVAGAVISLDLVFVTQYEPIYPDDYNTTAVDLMLGETAIIKARYNMNE